MVIVPPYAKRPEIHGTVGLGFTVLGRLHAVTIKPTFGNAENVEASVEVEVDVRKKFEPEDPTHGVIH